MFNGSHFGLSPSNIHKMTDWVEVFRVLWRKRTGPIWQRLFPDFSKTDFTIREVKGSQEERWFYSHWLLWCLCYSTIERWRTRGRRTSSLRTQGLASNQALPELALGTFHATGCYWQRLLRQSSPIATCSVESAYIIGPCALFLCFSSLFFHQTYAGARKKTKCPQKKKNALAECSRPPGRQMTHPTYCVQRGHSFLFFFFSSYFQTMIE